MEKTLRLPNGEQQAVLDQVQVRLVERAELENFKQLLNEHHYLGVFAYPRKKVQSRITPPKRCRFRSGFQPIPERFRPHRQALAVYGTRSVRID
jgi:hypothetical protein